MEKKDEIQTVEMNTGGEAVRIIVSGYPAIQGSTILEQRQYVKENFDHLRTMLMWEPRGHFEMYGALLVPPTHPKAHLAVLFMHNEGYSTMCGHACLSLGRYAIDYKLVEPVSPETLVNVQCPCGLVPLYVEYDSKTGQTGSVRFESVPSYAVAVNQTVKVDGLGEVNYDLGYGGAFYAVVDVTQFNMDLKLTPVEKLRETGTAITDTLKSEVKLSHPESDLAFLYGTILTDGRDDSSHESTSNICIFAKSQVDRSPCGSGSCMRTAIQYHKKLRKLGESKVIVNGKTGSEMRTKAVRVEPCHGHPDAVVVEVSGRGYYTGRGTYWAEPNDPKAYGFLVQ